MGSTALGGPDGQGGPHVFVVDPAAPVLDDADRHHLERVLRLRAGDPLTVSDGAGAWVPCRFGDELEPDGEIRHEQRLDPALTIGFAPVKGDRPEWVVQKLTELGIDRIVVLSTDRSVVRWEGDRAERQMERLTKVAREAAMQCRRCHLPTVDGVVPVADIATGPDVARADVGGQPPTLARTTLLVGPEGGWTEGERNLTPVAIGVADHVLRSETAAVAVSALYSALRAHRVAS